MVVEILLNGPFSTFNLNGIAQNTESGREWRQGRRMTILVLARISVPQVYKNNTHMNV